MDITQFLAKVMGLFLVVVSVWLLFNLKDIEKYVQDFFKNKMLVIVTEMATLLLGLMLVIAHTKLGSFQAVAVTVISWAVMIKAVLWILLPERTETGVMLLNKKSLHALSAVIGIALGGYLVYLGMM